MFSFDDLAIQEMCTLRFPGVARIAMCLQVPRLPSGTQLHIFRNIVRNKDLGGIIGWLKSRKDRSGAKDWDNTKYAFDNKHSSLNELLIERIIEPLEGEAELHRRSVLWETELLPLFIRFDLHCVTLNDTNKDKLLRHALFQLVDILLCMQAGVKIEFDEHFDCVVTDG